MNLLSQVFSNRLGRRLALLCAAIGVLLVPILSGLVLLQDYRSRAAQLEHHLEEIAAASQPALQEALWLGDSTLVRTHLAGLKNVRDMALVQLEQVDRPAIAVGERPAADVPVFERRVTIRRTFRDKELALGTLTLVVSLERLRMDLRREAWLIVLAQTLQVAVVAGLILFGFHRIAGRRLRRMAEFLAGYRRGITVERMVPPGAVPIRADELDRLALEFDHLTERLAEEQSLLEQRVAQRTRELRESEANLKRAQAVAHVGSWNLDLAGKGLTWSEETHRIFGVAAGTQLTYEDFLASIHPDDRDAVDTAWQAALKGAPYDINHRIVVGGQIKWVREQAELAFDNAGQLSAGIGTVQDITAQILAEQELKRSNAELEQFSYAISHDMRQPLRMITSYMKLLEKRLAGQLDGEKREFFDFAIGGAQRLEQMLVALLEYSRVGRKGEPLDWIASRELLDEALLFLRPEIAEAQAELHIIGDWPRVFVSRDEIMRLIQNFVGNALKYRVAGRTPEIAVTSEVVGDEWRLSVADNGVGIIPSQIHRLFQVFQRLHTHAAYEGTGVGLALCRKIAEHHGGKIGANSQGEEMGSTFWVKLPLHAPDPLKDANDTTNPLAANQTGIATGTEQT